jgi:hypothetical protein
MRGLADLIRPDWIRMFSPDELQMVISGSVQELDLNDLRSNCNYGGGYHDNHPSGLSLTFHRNPFLFPRSRLWAVHDVDCTFCGISLTC